MRSLKGELNYNYKKMARLIFYGVLSVFGVALLTGILNIVFLISAAVVYVNTDSSYINGGRVMEALHLTKSGYELDEELAEEFAQKEQWAMLLDENGRVIWLSLIHI